MAKVKGPLLSMEASGTFAKRLIFTSGKQGQNVTCYHTPTGKATIAQRTIRDNFKNAKNRWKLLNASEKLDYAQRADFIDLTGYNLFLQEWTNYDDMILIGKDEASYSTTTNVSAGGEELSKVENLEIEVGDEIEVTFVVSNRAIVGGVNFGMGLKIGSWPIIRVDGTGTRFAMDAKRAALWKVRIKNKLINGNYPFQAFGSSSSMWTLYQPALTLSTQQPVAASQITSVTVLAYNTNGTAIVDCSDLKIYKIS